MWVLKDGLFLDLLNFYIIIHHEQLTLLFKISPRCKQLCAFYFADRIIIVDVEISQ